MKYILFIRHFVVLFSLVLLPVTNCMAAEATGISLHVGLNEVDPRHYGSKKKLGGCINDALAFGKLAEANGFSTVTILLNEQATTTAFRKAIEEAAAKLVSGDCFLVTVASHGGQVLDKNGDEKVANPNDQLDETWCLYDRQWIDDESYQLWHLFKPGVLIVVIADTCHSGTSIRDNSGIIMSSASLVYVEGRENLFRSRGATQRPMFDTEFARALITGPELREFMSSAKTKSPIKLSIPNLATIIDTNSRSAQGADDPIYSVRALPREELVEIYTRNSSLYDSVQRDPELARGDNATISASVILLAACQDYQSAADTGTNGAFTSTLLAEFGDGAFSGSYKGLLQAASRNLAEHFYSQTPNYLFLGTNNPDFETARPFTLKK